VLSVGVYAHSSRTIFGSSKASITSMSASVGFVRLLCLKSSNRIMDDDEVLFVIVYSFPRNMFTCML
jgi:hypothetical protein